MVIYRGFRRFLIHGNSSHVVSYTQCLGYNIYSAWFFNIRISTCSHKECNWHLQYKSVGLKKIYPLHHGDSFHPSMAFIVLLYGDNSWMKVLIIPGLYFPNYSITYLPHDISRDFKKCEYINLRREWTHAVFKESLLSLGSVRIYYHRISSVY